MVIVAAGPPETMASAAVPSAPLADVAFIDADADAAATDSDNSERVETASSSADPPPPPPPPDGGSPEPPPEPEPEPAVESAPKPLKSALKRGSARRHLQVVINESRNTYCEAAPADEAPLLVRALSLRLPEVLRCQSPSALVTLSAPDAYRRMVAGEEHLQETAVDDSEGGLARGEQWWTGLPAVAHQTRL